MEWLDEIVEWTQEDYERLLALRTRREKQGFLLVSGIGEGLVQGEIDLGQTTGQTRDQDSAG